MSLILDGTAGVTFPSGSGTQAAQSKVLQVVNAAYSTQISTSTSTYVDTGLTATITPLFTTSKILILISLQGAGKDTNSTIINLRLLNGASVISTYTTGSVGYTGTSAANYVGGNAYNYLDSPATTSSVTYKVQFCSGNNNAAVTLQNASSISTITLMEIAG
jgi:hypothetical protein